MWRQRLLATPEPQNVTKSSRFTSFGTLLREQHSLVHSHVAFVGFLDGDPLDPCSRRVSGCYSVVDQSLANDDTWKLNRPQTDFPDYIVIFCYGSDDLLQPQKLSK